MTEEQLSRLWAFARGDTVATDFERWFLDQRGLEDELGEDLHWSLLSGDYAGKDSVWALRQSLAPFLEPLKPCECPAVRDGAAIPMGGDFYFEKVFDTLELLASYGPDKWWLYISKCRVCSTVWLVAQDDRIHDNFYLTRISEQALRAAVSHSDWPGDYLTYEQVLRAGPESGNVCRFLDNYSPALVETAKDLRRERPDIPAGDVAYLLAIPVENAERLLRG